MEWNHQVLQQFRPRGLRFTFLSVCLIGSLAAVWVWILLRSDQQTPKPAAGLNASSERNRFLPEAAEDVGWPFVRGQNYDGKSPEEHLAEAWPAEGPPVVWTRQLGPGYSAFVSSGNRVYTQYQTLAGQFVVCLDAETGGTIWEYRYDWPFEPGGIYPGPRATPTLADGHLYFAAPSGLVGCLTFEGKLLWSVNVTKKFRGRGTEFGYSCSPVVKTGLVLLPVGGRQAAVIALDARTGETVWRSGDEQASYTPVLPIKIAGQDQVIGYLANALVGYELATGKELWRKYLSQGYDEHAAWPLYSEPHLWISGPFRSGSQLFKLSGGDKPEIKDVRSSKLLSNDICSSVLHSGHVYGFDLQDVQAKVHRPSRGEFRCIDLLTGTARWSTPQTGQASVIVADEKLILLNDSGDLILARASPDQYTELSRVAVLRGEICWTPPTLHRGRVYVRNHSQAVCLYVGRPDWLSIAPGNPTLTAADIPQHTYRDLSTLLGVEPEYAFDIPSKQWLQDWYLSSLVLLVLAMGIASVFALTARGFRGGWPASGTVRAIIRTAAFLLGAAGTTVLSLWRQDFVFTWPVALFVAFDAVVWQVRSRQNQPGESASLPSPWRGRVLAILFVAVCGTFYLLCRRLSLVTEWSYLCGFPAAVPFSLAASWLGRRRSIVRMAEPLLTLCAFSAYYWGSVAFLLWRYRVGS